MSLLIESELAESASVTSRIDPGQVEALADAIIAAVRRGGKVVLFGNGGSAADAVHLAAELSGRYRMDRPAIDGIALSSLSSITGIGNDYGYERVFVRQLEACLRPGDVVIGLSTSGRSRNVLLALEYAKERGAVTAAFTGAGGELKDLVDLPVVVPSTSTPRIQEGYLCAGHIMCGLVERGLYGRRAVFVDRDDTLVRDVPYCARPEDLHLFPGAAAAVRRLNEAGYLVVLVTNQSGVGRGYFTEETLGRIHDKLRADLAAEGARLDAIYYCPHRPDEGCRCRKPALGLLERAVAEWNIDLRSSYVVGDGENDMALGRAAGCRTVQVTAGRDFSRAVDEILGR